MVFDMWEGFRHAKVHKAVSQPKVGGHDLAAGCAFAKDMLKACLGQVKAGMSRRAPAGLC